jgi:hypothetical protein
MTRMRGREQLAQGAKQRASRLLMARMRTDTCEAAIRTRSGGMAIMELRRYFDDVEARIDEAQERRIAAEWLEFCALRCTDEFFSPARSPAPSRIDWPQVCINAAFGDMELMLYLQLRGVSDMLSAGSGLMLGVRANYGTCIIPSMFGAEVFPLPDKADTLPGALPLKGGVDALRDIAESRQIDYERGLAPRVFEFGERWQEAVRDYPRISAHVHLYNPDLQGPFALADMLAGSGIYYALYDEPEMILSALEHMTDVYLDFTRRWQAKHPPYDALHSIEWGLMHRGHTMLRNDAIVNLSPAMYREFAMPYDARVFAELGGGMHFCGRGDHYMADACAIPGLSCINMSQPELNDMNKIYAATIEQGKLIVGMPAAEITRAGMCGQRLLGRVQSSAAQSAYRA